MIEYFKGVPHSCGDGGRARSHPYERKDCTVRAIAFCLQLPYAEAHNALRCCGRKDKHGFYVEPAYLKLGLRKLRRSHYQYGYFGHFKKNKRGVWAKCKSYRKTNARSITLAKALAKYPVGRFIFESQTHCVAVIDGVLHDSGYNAPKVRVVQIWTPKIIEKISLTPDLPSDNLQAI